MNYKPNAFLEYLLYFSNSFGCDSPVNQNWLKPILHSWRWRTLVIQCLQQTLTTFLCSFLLQELQNGLENATHPSVSWKKLKGKKYRRKNSANIKEHFLDLEWLNKNQIWRSGSGRQFFSTHSYVIRKVRSSSWLMEMKSTMIKAIIYFSGGPWPSGYGPVPGRRAFGSGLRRKIKHISSLFYWLSPSCLLCFVVPVIDKDPNHPTPNLWSVEKLFCMTPDRSAKWLRVAVLCTCFCREGVTPFKTLYHYIIETYFAVKPFVAVPPP